MKEEIKIFFVFKKAALVTISKFWTNNVLT